MLDDVVHDVLGRVVHPAGLADLRLLLDLGPVGLRQPDHLAQELLVDLPQNLRRQDGELIRALGVVQSTEDVLEELVVEAQTEGELIRRLAAFLRREVEQARVVALVRAAEDFAEALVEGARIAGWAAP